MVSDNDFETGGAKQERQDNTETTQWASTHPDRQDIGISYPSQNESAGPKLFTQHEDLDTPEDGEPKTEIDKTQKPTSFYNEHGQILNPAHAEEVAYVAKEEGIDKAIQIEQALKREVETGLTPEQEYSRAIKEGLLEKYPNAFERIVLEDGTTAAFIREYYNKDREGDKKAYPLDPTLLFTDEGMLWAFRLRTNAKEGNLTPQDLIQLLNHATKDNNPLSSKEIKIDHGLFSVAFDSYCGNISNYPKEHLSELSDRFKKQEEESKRWMAKEQKKKEEQIQDPQQKAKKILDLL